MNKDKVIIPPIKCQGIKSKLVNFISKNLEWDTNGKGIWYEPFLGSGVVLFNIQPKKAIVSDLNEHIINFYKRIQDYSITPEISREFLEYHGEILSNKGEKYYYEMRDEFNDNKDSLYFLFLTRSCFNGIMRFNKKGNFNVPFCKNNNRFSKAYITKICNQILNVQNIIEGKDWVFLNQDWRESFKEGTINDFYYLDPPYIGRNTGYIGDWNDNEAIELSKYAKNISSNVMLSMWKENKYRSNIHLKDCWNDFKIEEIDHFYHVGSKEKLRNKMKEILAIKF